MKCLNVFFSVVIVSALATAGWVKLHSTAKLNAGEAAWRQQDQQCAALAAENQRLANLVAQGKTNHAAAEDPAAELAQLRASVTALKQQTNQLAQLAREIAATRLRAGTRFFITGDSNLLAHNQEMGITFRGGPREGGKLNDARVLTAALLQFADKHQGAFPTSLDQITSYLPPALAPDAPSWQNAPLSGSNDFEIVYQGTAADLTNIPPRRVALIRERQPWQLPDGSWARVYGYADGAASTVESDDNFQTWDVQHIVPPATGNAE